MPFIRVLGYIIWLIKTDKIFILFFFFPSLHVRDHEIMLSYEMVWCLPRRYYQPQYNTIPAISHHNTRRDGFVLFTLKFPPYTHQHVDTETEIRPDNVFSLITRLVLHVSAVASTTALRGIKFTSLWCCISQCVQQVMFSEKSFCAPLMQ